ncbi:MAG: hypothetical protein KGJ60_13755 [Verrucomicrobiota bacterium]|nr:hypothetical protein [Verrucomicrobiota bacterium]
MSFLEIKQQVAELPWEDRFKLSAFLAELDERHEAEFRGQVDNRMKAMDAGRKMSAEEFEGRHRKLQQSGR